MASRAPVVMVLQGPLGKLMSVGSRALASTSRTAAPLSTPGDTEGGSSVHQSPHVVREELQAPLDLGPVLHGQRRDGTDGVPHLSVRLGGSRPPEHWWNGTHGTPAYSGLVHWGMEKERSNRNIPPAKPGPERAILPPGTLTSQLREPDAVANIPLNNTPSQKHRSGTPRSSLRSERVLDIPQRPKDFDIFARRIG